VTAGFSAAIQSSPAAFTDIRYERRRGVLISRQGGALEVATGHHEGAGLARCLNPGHAWGVCAFHHPADAATAVRRAHELSLALPARPARSLPPVPGRVLDLDLVAGRDPGSVSLEEKLALTGRVAAVLTGADRRIVDSRIRYLDWVAEVTVVSSEGLDLTERRPGMELSVLAVAEEAGTVERAVDGHSPGGNWGELERWAAGVQEVANRAVLLLHAPPVRAGRYPVVLDPRAGGILAHRVVGHLCQGDDASHPSGPLAPGTRLGPEALSVGDDGTVHGLRGTRAFDDEGMPPRAAALVQHGVVVSHLHTRTSAMLAGVAPTGSARADGAVMPAARLANTFIAGGKGELPDLLRDIDEGLYLTDPVGATLEDGQAGLRAGFARMIRRGDLAEPVKGVTLLGEPLALLGLVDRVAGDFRWDTSPSWCARPGAGRVPVAVGAPHLRLIDVVVSGGA